MTLVDGGSVTTPSGFVAGSAACGLKPSGALDVGVLFSERATTSALVDTTSALPSAAIRHTRTCDLAGLRGVIVNAGNANAATGSPGVDDAAAMGERTAATLAVESRELAVCSTGTIGDRLPMETVGSGIDTSLTDMSTGGGIGFGQAICTTDSAPKGGGFQLELGSRTLLLGAAAKGAGMINPNMATMLAYITTDAAIGADDLMRITRDAAEVSFNRISVDGQMSPSDTLIVFANGEGEPLSGDELAVFGRALAAICRWLAIQMVKDGEGADHAVRLLVSEALDDGEAERVAVAIGNSPLVKTAIFGRDPNWGRVSQAVGQALAGAPEVNEPRLTFDGQEDGAQVMERAEYDLGVSLGRGEGAAERWVSDLTYAYVELNAEYHT